MINKLTLFSFQNRKYPFNHARVHIIIMFWSSFSLCTVATEILACCTRHNISVCVLILKHYFTEVSRLMKSLFSCLPLPKVTLILPFTISREIKCCFLFRDSLPLSRRNTCMFILNDDASLPYWTLWAKYGRNINEYPKLMNFERNLSISIK